MPRIKKPHKISGIRTSCCNCNLSELCLPHGMSDDAYASNSVVLETASICEFSYDDLEELCHSLRGLNHQLMRLASKEINADQRMLLLLGKRKAEEKLAAFLLSLSTRYKPRGLSATNYNLPMSRQDIGNYLGLAIATVSRLFARFQEEGLLKVNRREVTITDLPRLKGMVEGYRKYALTSAS